MSPLDLQFPCQLPFVQAEVSIRGNANFGNACSFVHRFLVLTMVTSKDESCNCETAVFFFKFLSGLKDIMHVMHALFTQKALCFKVFL